MNVAVASRALLTRSLLTAGTALAFALSPGTGHAQPAYPSKPIRIIVPAGAGDSCDILSRLIAPKITERLGQPGASRWGAIFRVLYGHAPVWVH